MKYAKVEGYSNLIRDLNTNAIINTDTIESDNYTIAKIKKEHEQQRIDKIESDLTEMKSSIDEIKQLLRGIRNES